MLHLHAAAAVPSARLESDRSRRSFGRVRRGCEGSIAAALATYTYILVVNAIMTSPAIVAAPCELRFVPNAFDIVLVVVKFLVSINENLKSIHAASHHSFYSILRQIKQNKANP